MKLKSGNRFVEITHATKILYPVDKITKGKVARYYQQCASRMMALIKGHLIVMQRFPEGIGHEGFFHKDAPESFAQEMKLVEIARADGKKVHYVQLTSQTQIVYLANYNTLVFHSWLSKADMPDKPDRIIFDLDPSGKITFETIKKTAFVLKELLESYGYHPYVMTTGSRGLHVVVPIKRRYAFDIVKNVACNIALELNARLPKVTTLELRKEKRGNRIFIDYLRNEFGQTAVAPYSLRAKEGAPIALPLSWHELEKSVKKSDQFRLKDIKKILKRNDPWKNFFSDAVSLKQKKRSKSCAAVSHFYSRSGKSKLKDK